MMSLFCLLRLILRIGVVVLARPRWLSARSLYTQCAAWFDEIPRCSIPYTLETPSICRVFINLDTLLRRKSNSAKLLCAVSLCRMLIREAFEANSSHNGQLHIITEILTSALHGNSDYFFWELLNVWTLVSLNKSFPFRGLPCFWQFLYKCF